MCFHSLILLQKIALLKPCWKSTAACETGKMQELSVETKQIISPIFLTDVKKFCSIGCYELIQDVFYDGLIFPGIQMTARSVEWQRQNERKLEGLKFFTAQVNSESVVIQKIIKSWFFSECARFSFLNSQWILAPGFYDVLIFCMHHWKLWCFGCNKRNTFVCNIKENKQQSS